MNVHPSKLPPSDLQAARLDGAECLFDPELHDGPDPLATIEHPDSRAAREEVAREVCGSCPVAAKCLTYALRTRPARGIWAGFSADEIRQLADEQGALLGSAA
jgi:WhiB family redox-sensing transcriptional regulator